ncbi:hypothetical protein M413DRAFT_14611 [Hebeloma cylindrosporum]|uniref:Uncharacterized protein n=1 Tax=Hebeloma cylindrosporum TaxID=76867 RepID=A0A0C2XBI4_HEBCY|nr:hypothetical protein M413DRAFT_14611 [Hebeloma cylindrosporum h7]
MSIQIQDFSDRDVKPLIDLCDSCQHVKPKAGYWEYISFHLQYSSAKLYLQAQDRIEGWDSEACIKQRVAGSELSKIFGWAAFLANNFLARHGQSKTYGFPRHRSHTLRTASQLDKVLSLIEEHKFSDPKILEVTRIREMMEDVAKLPPSILPEEDYAFHLRAATLSHEWARTRTLTRWFFSADQRRLSVHSKFSK